MRATLSNANKFLTIAVAAGALLVGAGLGTDHALAIPSDAKNYPGTMCRPASLNARVSYERNGSIANRSEQRQVEVLCPIIRDRVSGFDGFGQVYVSFGGPHESESFRCSLYERQTLDNKVQKKITDTGFRNGYGTMAISIGRWAQVPRTSFYMLNCWLPAKHKGLPPPMLHSYQVLEQIKD